MPSATPRSAFWRLGPASLALGAAFLLAPAAGAQDVRLDPATGEAVVGDVLSRPLAEALGEATALAGADLTLVGRLADGETRGFDLVGDRLYRSNGGYLEVLDVANPAAPVVLGRFLAEQGVVQTVDVVGTLAYVAVARGTPFGTRGGLLIVDVSNPAAMTLVGGVPGRSVNEVRVVGTTAYLGAGALRLYDVSNPAAPVAQGVVTVTGGIVLSVAVEGTTAYLAAGNAGLRVVDVANPAAPTVVGTLATLGGFATRVVAAAGRAYVSVQGVGLVIVDVTNPAAPAILGSYFVDTDGQPPDNAGQVRAVAVSGTTAYVGDDRGLNAVDVSNPAAPTLRGRVDFGQSGSSQYILVDGGRVFVGSRYQGVRVLNVTAPTPTVAASIANGGFSFKVNVVGGIAYVADLLGQVRLIDVSNPAAPAEISRVQGMPNADGVDVLGTTAYVVNRAEPPAAGVTRLDVSNPAAPVVLGFTPTARSAYGVDVDGATVYVATGVNGAADGTLISASGAGGGFAPLDEEQAGNQAFGVTVAGGRAYVARFGSGLAIFDVTNPAAIVPLSLNPIGGFSQAVEVDGTTAYLADSQTGASIALTVIDAANPAAPAVIGTAAGFTGAGAADVALGDGYAYAAVDFVGLYQYDRANPAALALRTMVQTSDRATGVDAEGRTVVLVDAGAGVWVFEAALVTAGEGDAVREALAVTASPNPSAGPSRLSVRLPDAADVTVEVFSVLGQRVARLDAGALAAGTHTLALDGRAWAAGVYVVRLTAGGQTATSLLTVTR